MQSPDHIKDLTVEEGSLPALAGLLAGFGEEIVAEPEELEGALRRMAANIRERLRLGAVEISASVGESLRISILEGSAVSERGTMFEAFPIRRGKLSVGVVRGYPAAPKRRGRRGNGTLLAG
ncbi:MAG: hypothetical protein AVDCRST_MAG37-424 [uncultured Rubrobacteraceae bacterium]|uniref:Uncharacterized protein n=1 Tax=uncultured Rubrobacteraceae bacterium TaxID=349277 RepID=A0A6J4PXK8_9ACTN|nr:MAG: hypothetical protein AVDCRST_MAG37-424 [uncultured Rubrobacteraceae bacterium]